MTICSIFRVISTAHMTTGTSDTAFAFGPVLLWAQAETACGFFTATVPLLPRVLRETAWLSRVFGTRRQSTLLGDNEQASQVAGYQGASCGRGVAGLRRTRRVLRSQALAPAETAHGQADDEVLLRDLESNVSSGQSVKSGGNRAYNVTAVTEVTVTHHARNAQSNSTTPSCESVSWAE